MAVKLGNLPVDPAIIDRTKGALSEVQVLVSQGTLGSALFGILYQAGV